MPKTIFSTGQECLQQLLRQMRTEKGMTQEGLARLLRRPQSFVSKYESGERLLDLIELREISQAFGVSLVSLVGKFEKAMKR